MRPLLLAALAGGVAVASAVPAHGAGDPTIAKGKALFASVGCYECHGYAGQGGAAGPHIAGTAWPSTAFFAYVRHPAREMPPFTPAVLSDDQLAAIYAYVKSLPSPPPPPSSAGASRPASR